MRSTDPAGRMGWEPTWAARAGSRACDRMVGSGLETAAANLSAAAAGKDVRTAEGLAVDATCEQPQSSTAAAAATTVDDQVLRRKLLSPAFQRTVEP